VKKRLARILPKTLRTFLKKIYYFPGEIIDQLRKRDSMIPPPGMIFIGAGDFEQIGKDFKKHFIELGNLQPDHRVLDVGCGIGRMAIPLTSYLSKEGEYWGFDIVKKGIEWCQKRISPKYGNFHFLHSDIYNKEYNPKGKIQARDYKFPFEDQFFDFVFLTSVFTHMLPADMENYVSEMGRVLKRGGKCMVTFFLLNDESTNLIQTGNSTLDFRFEIEGCLTTDKNTPEDAIAYNEKFVKRIFDKYGLMITQPIHYGSWCKRPDFFEYQDLIVAEKR
jgi:ubiquinone/menaquinone biosynthesis C-methylase UbiE